VIWIYDPAEDRLQYVSPGCQRVWGLSPAEALADACVWRASIHPDDRANADRALERAASNGDSVSRDYRIVRPDGGLRCIRDTVFPIRSAEGRLVELGGVAEDVTHDASPSVYLVEHDPRARESRAAMLRAAGHSVKAFASEDVFLDVADVLACGCVLVRPPEAAPDRYRLARLLKARRIAMPVIVEAALAGDIGLAIEGMKAGAADILDAPASPGTLVAAVAAALAGLGKAAPPDHAVETARLQISMMSEREREVLDGLLAGGTNKTIARDLGISPRTVESHRARVMERLAAHTLPEAVLTASSAGLKPSRRSPPSPR
jgi:PAS domain S-box-containing protein